MPTIKFKDGTKKKVGYDAASRAYAVLIGKKQPENEQQAEFVKKIKHVAFDDAPKPIHERSNTDKSKRAKEVKEIMDNPYLKGRDKAREVSKLLKGIV